MTGIGEPLTKITASVRDVCFFVGPTRQISSRIKQSPANQLIIVTGGVYRAKVDLPSGPRHLRAVAGNLVFWPVGVDHTDQSETGHSLRCIIIWFDWSDPPSDLPLMIHDAGPVIDRLAERLLSITHEPYYQTELGFEFNVYLHAILVEFVSRARLETDDLRARIIGYIEQHIHEPIRLDDLTQVASLQKHHFIRRYKQLTGLTPMEEVRKRKATYAKHVLQLNPTRPLKSVAQLVGIRHEATLCRLLSRYAGTTVRDIRRATRMRKDPA